MLRTFPDHAHTRAASHIDHSRRSMRRTALGGAIAMWRLGMACAFSLLGALDVAHAHDTLGNPPAPPAAPFAEAAGADAASTTSTFAALAAELLAWQPHVSPQNAPQPAPQDATRPPSDDEPHLRSWEMPAIEIVGEMPPELREEELVGPYAQPRWTTRRRFATVRTYVIPEGEIDVEYWARIDDPKHGDTKIRNLYEVEIGLPHRFQLDFYLKAQNEGNWVPFDMNGQQIELRYAFADWGKIWGNPTAYLEWINNYSEPDAWEGKLLFADQLAPSWHWSANFSCEQQTTGDQERELQFTYGISKTITDEVFSVGAEFKAQRINAEEDRSEFTDEFFIGPSFQYRPFKRTHIDFAPLVGVGGESPNAQIFLILGYEF